MTTSQTPPPYRSTALLIIVIVVMTLSVPLALMAQPASGDLVAAETASGPELVIYASQTDSPAPFVPPPASLDLYYARQQESVPETAVATAAGNITVVYPATCSDSYGNSATNNFPTSAKAAFQYAVDIWNSLLLSSAPIQIEACWWPFDSFPQYPSNILGGASADSLYANFNCPSIIGNTFYTTAQVLLCGGNVNPGYDIHAKFNTTASWYLGTDGNTPFDQYDFASVVLHEIGHGLGFSGSMNSDGTNGYWGYATNLGAVYPVIYDHFTELGSGTTLLSYSFGPSLHTALTSDDVYFDGTNTNAANGGSRVKLFAPSTWLPGSSYAHVDTVYDNTSNALMTYSISNGEAQHSPGPITLGIFKDMATPIETYPVISGLPALLLYEKNTPPQIAINLESRVSDADTAVTDLTINVTSTDPGVGVTYDPTTFNISISPAAEFVGTTTVTVTVTDTAALSVSDTFDIEILPILSYTYLPVIIK